jgi:hypothetical protein
MILAAAAIVEPALTPQTQIDPPAGETHQLIQHTPAGLTGYAATPTLRTDMLSLVRCDHGAASRCSVDDASAVGGCAERSVALQSIFSEEITAV